MLKEFDRIQNKNLSETCCLKWAEMVPELLKLNVKKAMLAIEYTETEITPGLHSMCSKHDQA